MAARPDALVIIDSPDFTHRVARRVRKAAPDIPIINYAPPSVWAWRQGRARAMRAYVDEVLAILPFEPAAFERLHGPRCTYVGHPLAERIGDLRPNAEEARRRLADPPLVLVLPGSRRGEIKRFAATFGAAIAQAAATRRAVRARAADACRMSRRSLADATADWPVRPRIVVEAAEKHAAFRSARAALAKSGTVTLELALAQVPTVAAYRIAAVGGADLSAAGAGELGDPRQSGDRRERGAGAAAGRVRAGADRRQARPRLIGDTPERRRQLAGFARLDAVMEIGGEPPSQKAARAVLDVVARGSA